MDLRRPSRRPLPRGAHGLSREYVAQDQRERLIDAMADVLAEHGYADVTVAHVLEAAKVSRRTFYEHFADKEDCFVATYEAIVARARKHVLEGYDPNDSWAGQVRAVMSRLLEFMAADHAFARVMAVEPLTAGGRALEAHSAATRKTIPLLERGRGYAERPDELPDTTEEAIAGAIGSIAYWHVFAGQSEKLTELLPDLLYYALAPYLGHDAALAESRKS